MKTYLEIGMFMLSNLSRSKTFLFYVLFEKAFPFIMQNTHYVNSKALKLESVSPLYNAKQGDLDVADV
jgi:hypothetical protein